MDKDEFIHKIKQLVEYGIKLPDTVLSIILLMPLLLSYKIRNYGIQSNGSVTARTARALGE